ncbi:MAG: FMN-binding protein [Micrococcales bacterium]
MTVTKSAGKITDVTLDIAGATGGRQNAFSVLVSAALQANGSNFGNLSGATYTTDAFKQALDSALAKF